MGDLQATILSALKLFGLVISLVSGVVATLFETKEMTAVAKGLKKINRFGKIVFGCIIGGFSISALTQLFEDHGKRVDAANAAAKRTEDVRRLTYIIDGTQRIAHRLEPMVWTVQVRYKVDANSPLLPWVQRVQAAHQGHDKFILGGDVLPDIDNPSEHIAATTMLYPPCVIAVLPASGLSGEAKDHPLMYTGNLPLTFAPSRHAVTDKTVQPVLQTATPPYTGRVYIEQSNGGLSILHTFQVRDSPLAAQATGVISPLDLSDYVVLAETQESNHGVVVNVNMLFPTASAGVDVPMVSTNPINGMTRSKGILTGEAIRKVLNIADVVQTPDKATKP